MSLPIPLYRSTELRQIETAAAGQDLMARAGHAAAELACRLCTERNAEILILAGPGNNGGDAFEAARLLRERFFATTVVFTGQAEKLPPDAAAAYRRFLATGGRIHTELPEQAHWSLIIDGLFGIGLTREITAPYAELIGRANALARRDACPLLALDCPSGLNADTGQRHGATIRASHTISFISGKPGLFTAEGPDYCGEISIATLALDAQSMLSAPAHTIAPGQFSRYRVARQRNSHKGSYGSAGLLGGECGMAGAALLAARAALRLGSGKVYVGLLDANAPTVDAQQPELMLRPAEGLFLADLTALACGPGMGCSDAARQLLEKACQQDIPLLLDADALNILADAQELRQALVTRTAPTLLTPHPAEAARLLNSDVAGIQADRPEAVLELAKRFNAFVVLKGCGSLVASPQGEWFINTSGNPGLATAGSGDVLTGMLVALLAQGWPALEALLAAVHLHGMAADHQVAEGHGPIGLTAGELIDSARYCLNRWVNSA